VTRPVAVEARRAPQGGWEAQLTLEQPDYRIKPFVALLGALKVSPTVVVRLHLPTAPDSY
jgi:hypothetical protein